MLLIYFDDCKIKLDNRIKEYSETLMSGRIQTMEDYRSICGKIEGILESKQILTNIIKGYQNPHYLSEQDN